ncbi:hypothetical protein HZA86_00115 [Candidatus Uhrbacteria bacterium]|nr:hypothetical protein [Candidatus Uhrbacteria bacterium]
MRKQLLVMMAVTVLIVPMLSPTPARAFNAQMILEDDAFTNADTMTEEEIQRFLVDQGSGLAKYSVGGKRASRIIASAAQDWSINPQILLVILQKEQSLIQTKKPTAKQLAWATGYGVCDACSLSDPSVTRWKGFETQVRAAAEFFRAFFDNPDRLFVKVGAPITIDRTPIIPANIATAILYTYTPHFHGNEVFWALYNRLFVRQYPDGSLLKSPTSAVVWYLQNGIRRPIRSMAVLRSRFGVQPILTASTKSEIEKYPIGPVIGLANYSLVRADDGRIALISGDEYRVIESPEVFRQIGYNPEEVEDVDDQTLAMYQLGEPITIKSIYPTGALLKFRRDNQIYYVENGIAHSADPLVVKLRYGGRKLTVVDDLSQYTMGEPMTLPDGTLVKNPLAPTVYIISASKRRAIPTAKVFTTLGYSWKAVHTIPESLLALHPPGEPMDVPSADIPSSDPRPQLRK